MNWKNWPYWVKGGAIAFVATMTISTVSWYFYFWPNISTDCFQWNCDANRINKLLVEFIIGGTVVGFIIGTFYGKFKNRKKIIN